MAKKAKKPSTATKPAPVFDMPEPNDGIGDWGDLSRVRRVKETTHGVMPSSGVFRMDGPDYRAIIDPFLFEQMCDQDPRLQRLLNKCVKNPHTTADVIPAVGKILDYIFEECYLVMAFEVFAGDKALIAQYLLAKAAYLAVNPDAIVDSPLTE